MIAVVIILSFFRRRFLFIYFIYFIDFYFKTVFTNLSLWSIDQSNSSLTKLEDYKYSICFVP